MAMMFAKENALIIEVSAKRVNELIAGGKGLAFNFTKKRFKEWGLIPLDYQSEYCNVPIYFRRIASTYSARNKQAYFTL